MIGIDMKIVFAIPGLGFGGAERVVSILANKMVQEHEVRIILTSGSSKIAYPLCERIDLTVIPESYSVNKRWITFRKLCNDFKADVVLAFMDTVGIMACCYLCGTGIPVIVSERNDPSEKTRQLGLGFRILQKASFVLSSGYVFQSEGARNYYPAICQKKSCIILNPLDVEALPSREYDRIEKTIVSVGRLHPQKNHKLLITSFSKSKFCQAGYTLHIYGEGNLREELEKQIESYSMKEKIFLEGNQENILPQIKNAGVFVFTSNYEGLPNALIEAMAMGIPSISTDCSPGGARMLINDRENGCLIPCDNEQTLIEAMDEWYDNPEKMYAAGISGKNIRNMVNTATIADKWIRFINERLD